MYHQPLKCKVQVVVGYRMIVVEAHGEKEMVPDPSQPIYGDCGEEIGTQLVNGDHRLIALRSKGCYKHPKESPPFNLVSDAVLHFQASQGLRQEFSNEHINWRRIQAIPYSHFASRQPLPDNYEDWREDAKERLRIALQGARQIPLGALYERVGTVI